MTITSSTLRRLLTEDRPVALFDVRERGEYALGHISGACPLPRGLIEVLAPTLVPWHDTQVIVYCDDGHRSALAATTLESMGYQHVDVLEGGTTGWTAEGNDLEEGVNVLGKSYGEKVSVTGGIVQVEPDELAEMRESQDVLVVDARTPVEYGRGHIPGAISVPGGELASTLLSLPDRSRPVVVHCAGRTRSILGAKLVMDLGFERVFALRNGTMAWRMSGRDLEYTQASEDTISNETGASLSARFATSYVEGQPVRAWTPQEAQELATSHTPMYLLDVRRPEEFVARHAAGAINCAAGQLANGADEQIAVRKAQVICYSDHETRAKIGASTLSRIGYQHVGWLSGGLESWQAAGLPTESGRLPSYPAALAERAEELITPQEVHQAIGAGDAPILVDVRRSSEFALFHIPSSIWVPRGDLERRLLPHLDDPHDIVLVSDRGVRARLAAGTVRSLTGGRVRVLDGGIEAWVDAGHRVEDGLDGADVDLREAKEDAELVAPRPRMLERNQEDMVRYLTWEEQLGHAYESADSK